MTVRAHGVDLVDVARIEQMHAEHGDRFVHRVFTAHEAGYAQSGGALCAQRLAARFAAKEATFKAIGTGLRDGMCWTDVEVRVLPSGAPTLELTGRVAEIAREQGITKWLVSLSHAGGFAYASVIGISESAVGVIGFS
ncbi:MAG: holo-[acyl-carrier-protein] synthase [Phycisphaerales bacterium]|nr:holo-[acyl-carrier-protein] synthase [Phycisphaerales bacterium]